MHLYNVDAVNKMFVVLALYCRVLKKCNTLPKLTKRKMMDTLTIISSNETELSSRLGDSEENKQQKTIN